MAGRRFAALVVLMLIVAGGTLVALDRRGGGSTAPPSNVVPWLDRPASQPLFVRGPAPTPPAADARPCQAGDVQARLDSNQGSGQHWLYGLILTNVSDSACLLAGYPDLTAIEPGLPDVTAHALPAGAAPNDPTANMPPGGQTTAAVITADESAARETDRFSPSSTARYSQMRLDLPGGSILVAADSGRHLPLDAFCDFGVGRYGVRQPDPPPPLTFLVPTISSPKSVKVGTTLDFTVTLSNPTDAAIALDPCPNYEMFAPNLPKQRTFMLNCDTVKSIAAHSSQTYAMQLGLTAGSLGGSVMVRWSLLNPKQQASATIVVTY